MLAFYNRLAGKILTVGSVPTIATIAAALPPIFCARQGFG
jgi:hypothetical protein